MRADPPGAGWPWNDADHARACERDLGEVYRSCFASAAGRLVLDHLRKVFLLRRVAPTASDAELRHVEGQRAAVAWILALAGSGDRPDPGPDRPATERTAP
jgi:hypothetical protein